MSYRNHPAADYAAIVDDSTQVIDVRQPAEIVGTTIPGSINMPLSTLPDRVTDLDPARRTVVVCRSGARSATAAEFLTSQGFDDVVNLEGGVLAISRQQPNRAR